ncbi:hypothetical protein HY839_03240, partial [Candidatus Azambacteria bacterium]|nr:hypothetical protein [Candidatus Azambacteria bacterium]
MEEAIDTLHQKKTPSKPVIFNLSRSEDRTRFEELLKEGAIKQISDDYEEQQRELFGIRNPSRVYAPGFEEMFQEHYRSLS